MSIQVERAHTEVLRWVHPFHAVLLAGAVPLFLGALLSDIAYASTYQVQWTNFASWLIVGGLVFAGGALLATAIDLVRAERYDARAFIHAVLLLATWVLGFIAALVHAKDAWASMPAALVLSAIVLVLACVATWTGFSAVRIGDAR